MDIKTLIRMDEDELIQAVHRLSKKPDMLTDPDGVEFDAVRDWLARSGWQAPSYNEVHRSAAETIMRVRESCIQRFGEDSPEVRVIDRELINVLLARYGLTLSTL